MLAKSAGQCLNDQFIDSVGTQGTSCILLHHLNSDGYSTEDIMACYEYEPSQSNHFF